MELHCKICDKETYLEQKDIQVILCSKDCQIAWKIISDISKWEWKKGKKIELGDRNMEKSDYILLQYQPYDNSIIIQVVGVREKMRNKGIATRMIRAVESLGSSKVVLQSIMGDEMYNLAKKLGYKQYLQTMDFIKKL